METKNTAISYRGRGRGRGVSRGRGVWFGRNLGSYPSVQVPVDRQEVITSCNIPQSITSRRDGHVNNGTYSYGKTHQYSLGTKRGSQITINNGRNNRLQFPQPLFSLSEEQAYRNQRNNNTRRPFYRFHHRGGHVGEMQRMSKTEEDGGNNELSGNSTNVGECVTRTNEQLRTTNVGVEEQSRRANKRPVNSPTNSTNEETTVNQTKQQPNQSPSQSTSISQVNGQRNTKKKKKLDNELTEKTAADDRDLLTSYFCKLEINKEKKFDEQCMEVVKHLEQDDIDRVNRVKVVQDVVDIFSPYFASIEPKIYGSTFTNIAFKTSDLDIFLQCSKVQPEHNFVLEKGKLMYSSSKFSNIVRIGKARVPLIKAVHVQTKIDVDISTMSEPAVYNSMLIKHLLSSDRRLRPLAMMISLWSKLSNICAKHHFTSYSIVLMLILYLQRVEPPILPPLIDILKFDNLNAWPINFFEKPLKTKNNFNISQLFKGFFNFYTTLNFRELILSPYLGKEIPISNFQIATNLGDEFKIYKNKILNDTPEFKIKIINVQDPMEHNVNTTKNVNVKFLKLFQVSCERALQICNKHDENTWLTLITKQTPLKIAESKMHELLLQFPYKDKDWFQQAKLDFKTLLDILVFKIVEDNIDDEDEVNSFLVESMCNIFGKKCRFPLRLYSNGVIPIKELKNQIKMVINRRLDSSLVFVAMVTLEKFDNEGNVKITIVDKNTTGLNCFIPIVTNLGNHAEKFLNDIILLRNKINDTTTSTNVTENQIAEKVLDEDESKIGKTISKNDNAKK